MVTTAMITSNPTITVTFTDGTESQEEKWGSKFHSSTLAYAVKSSLVFMSPTTSSNYGESQLAAESDRMDYAYYRQLQYLHMQMITADILNMKTYFLVHLMILSIFQIIKHWLIMNWDTWGRGRDLI
jgi:hypothetical protein